MSYYQFYRHTTLGNTLQDSLNELIQTGKLKDSSALKILLEYDKVINKALMQVNSRLSFKADRLKVYRYCDDVWTLVMSDVKFRDSRNKAMTVANLKIVACQGKISADEFHAMSF